MLQISYQLHEICDVMQLIFIIYYDFYPTDQLELWYKAVKA